ncbi:chromosome partitioning protein ParA [Vibrio astriarenae]|uniref:chromosome partitioning protein ParA n=1 Tax=Vibrio astriarenae TaxID=1481923 RepID=UPI0037350023
MDKRPENSEEENVVVIEEKDNKTRLYIVLAVVLGAALGGVIGSASTASRWQETYDTLEVRYQDLLDEKAELALSVERRAASLDAEVEEQLNVAMEEQIATYDSEIADRDRRIAALNKQNETLRTELEEKQQSLATSNQANEQLNRQSDMQVVMLERSRELFQRELTVKSELAKLEDQRDEIIPTIDRLKKDCDLFLEGTSWDAKSDACDRQDEASSRLSQINQMIQVHRMDLKEIEAIAKEIGVK